MSRIKEKLKKINHLEYDAVIFFSILLFLFLYSPWTLNPTHTDWMLNSGIDIVQEYGGLTFYRRSPWLFPFGNFNTLSYPFPVSVIYVDVIPALALITKLFNPLLPENFQYFGLYQLLSMCLQGVLGTKLAKKYVPGGLPSVLSGMLFVFTPIFLWRMFIHPALTSHWIILLSLYTLVYYEESFAGRTARPLLWWALLGASCVMIHAYFVPMCLTLLTGFAYLDTRRNLSRQVSLPRIIQKELSLACAYLAGVFIPMWLMGAFTGGNVGQSLSFGWKKSFNLNGFINSQGWSPILKKLPLYHYSQSEGFAYLGLGVLIMTAISVGVTAWRAFRKKQLRPYISSPKIQAGALVFTISFFLALSPVITLGSRHITLPVPEFIQKLWIIFRCCGRLIWPAVYLLILYGIGTIGKINRSCFLTLILGFCLLVQIGDIGGKIYERSPNAKDASPFVSEFQDKGWKLIAENNDIDRLVILNISPLSHLASVTDYAERNRLKLSQYYFAHDFRHTTDAAARKAFDHPQASDLFLINEEDVLQMWQRPMLNYYRLDHMIIAYVNAIEGLDYASYEPWEDSYLINRTDVLDSCQGEEMIEDFLFLYPGGTDVLPIDGLPCGSYLLTVSGENLADSDLSVSEGEIEAVEMQNIRIRLDHPKEGPVTITIANRSDHDMVLYSTEVRPLF